MESVLEIFLKTLLAVGFVVGVGLAVMSPCLALRLFWNRTRRSPAPAPEPVDMRRDETVPDSTLLGNDRARLDAREAFDRATGVFPPFDPRSSQFLYWMRQEWQRLSAGERGSGNPKVRHAFYLECARERFAEIVAEGGLTRADADARLAGMRKVLEEAEHEQSAAHLPM